MQLYSADINILRDTHLESNPANGLAEEVSVLMEYYSRNGTGNSEGANTGGSFSTMAMGVAIGPDGQMSAFSLTEDTTDGVYHSFLYDALNTSNGNTNSYTIYIKAGTRNKAFVDGTQTGLGDPCIIDLTSGQIILAPTTARVSVTPAGNGWYKVDRTSVFNGSLEGGLGFGIVNSSNQISYDGNGTGSVLFFRVCDWMNRLIPSSALQSIANQAGAPPPVGFPDPAEINYGTGRWADSPLQIPFTAAPQAMSGLLEFIEKGTSLTPGSGIWSIGDYILSAPSLQIGIGSIGYQIVHINSASVSSTLGKLPNLGDLVRLRFSLNADGSVQIWQSLNGGPEITGVLSSSNSLGTKWSEGYSWLNGLGAGNQGFMAYRQCVVLPGANISLANLLSHFT